ncbi:hypothetical protein HMPREF1870_00078 [Bacteroidales bacterium KA00344]|nr:hypothetical protein HMPREF1870_00078 [Bacteroidales bacterium KA00344]
MRLAFLLILLLASFHATAQESEKPLKKFVVADIETRVPIRDVIVITETGYQDTTNYRGICYIPQTFDTLTVYKANYLTEKLLHKEVKDSTFLIPNSKRISEVTVWGKDRTTLLQENVDKWSRQNGQLPDPGKPAATIGLDFAKMLDKRYRKDQKTLRKNRKLFKEMDTYDDDPIVNAYKKEMEKRRLAAEQAKKIEEQKAKLKQDGQQTIEEKKQLTEKNKNKIEE